MTAARFTIRDPEVMVFGTRRDGVSVIFSLQWNEEAENWDDHWFIDSNQDAEEVERHRSIVYAIPCMRIDP
jgi:hypothetical protein